MVRTSSEHKNDNLRAPLGRSSATPEGRRGPRKGAKKEHMSRGMEMILGAWKNGSPGRIMCPGCGKMGPGDPGCEIWSPNGSQGPDRSP